jgi:diguanylate cyclase (GGDEF)-like protein
MLDMLDIVRENNRQKLRMRRIYLALIGAFLHTLACFALWEAGFFRTSLSGFILIFSAIWIIDLFFPFLVFTGVNKRFKDPSLTLIMVLWSQVAVMFTVYFIDEYRPFMLMFGIIGIAFSAFRLEAKEAIFAALFSIVLYMIVLLFQYHYHSEAFKPRLEWVVAFSYSLIAIFVAILASEINAMRQKWNDKTVDLQNHLHFSQTKSDVDEVTGLPNRRYILDVLEHQRNIINRELSYHFSIIVFDVDYFTKIESEQGRSVTEVILKYFATQFDAHLRKTDYFAHLKDGEFILVCPFTKVEQAMVLADRIRSLLYNAEINNAIPNFRLTISAGVTDYRKPEKIEDMFARVNKALGEAKNAGHNQIISV